MLHNSVYGAGTAASSNQQSRLCMFVLRASVEFEQSISFDLSAVEQDFGGKQQPVVIISVINYYSWFIITLF